jgi:hypothetical protein
MAKLRVRGIGDRIDIELGHVSLAHLDPHGGSIALASTSHEELSRAVVR